MQAAAGLGGGANRQLVQEGDTEGGAAVSGQHRGAPPPIVGSHKAVSVCFMFFYKTRGSTVFLLLSCYRVHPTASRQEAGRAGEKDGKN